MHGNSAVVGVSRFEPSLPSPKVRSSILVKFAFTYRYLCLDGFSYLKKLPLCILDNVESACDCMRIRVSRGNLDCIFT